MNFQEEDREHNRLKTELSMAPSISIMESKKLIEEIEMSVEVYEQIHNVSRGGVRNRQISSGVILDWKQFEDSEKVKSQFQMKDIEQEQKTVFSYLVQQWNNGQPSKIIYRWIKKFPKPLSSIQFPFLQEEEHIFRGSVFHYRKQGPGTYLIVKKFSDNSENVKNIRGEWFQDILRSGEMMNEKGEIQVLTSHQLKVSMKSRKKVTPYLEKNAAIERIRRKSGNSHQLLQNSANSGNSIVSIGSKKKD